MFNDSIMCLPSFLINTLQGGFNKSPYHVPGGSAVRLSRRVQPSCRSHAALQYNSSSVFPVHRQLQRTPISSGLFCTICYSSAVICYSLLQGHGCLWVKGRERREGRRVLRGVTSAGGTKGTDTGREGSESFLPVLQNLFYSLGYCSGSEKGTQAGEKARSSRLNRGWGDMCPLCCLGNGKGGKVEFLASGVFGNACPGVQLC